MAVQFDTGQCYKAGDKILTWARDISRNIATPTYVLRLAASSDPELRIAVADHLNTAEELLLLLADDDNADVRYAIAENHNTSRSVLNKLLDDPNSYVAHRAQTSKGIAHDRRLRRVLIIRYLSPSIDELSQSTELI